MIRAEVARKNFTGATAFDSRPRDDATRQEALAYKLYQELQPLEGGLSSQAFASAVK